MKRENFILPFVLVALIAVMALTGCNGSTDDSPPAAESVREIGQGATVFRFEVTDNEGIRSAWDIRTDEDTVAAALLALGLIAGDEGEWGLMVTEVNGLVADWDANQSFWAFYIDGEFAMAGADASYIEPGVTYAFVYTAG